MRLLTRMSVVAGAGAGRWEMLLRPLPGRAPLLGKGQGA